MAGFFIENTYLQSNCFNWRHRRQDGTLRVQATISMLRRLSIGLLASVVAIAPLPLKAQDGSAEDLGDVMSISLADVIKPTTDFQGAL